MVVVMVRMLKLEPRCERAREREGREVVSAVQCERKPVRARVLAAEKELLAIERSICIERRTDGCKDVARSRRCESACCGGPRARRGKRRWSGDITPIRRALSLLFSLSLSPSPHLSTTSHCRVIAHPRVERDLAQRPLCPRAPCNTACALRTPTTCHLAHLRPRARATPPS